jgi:hypothetical protein
MRSSDPGALHHKALDEEEVFTDFCEAPAVQAIPAREVRRTVLVSGPQFVGEPHAVTRLKSAAMEPVTQASAASRRDRRRVKR